MNDELQKALAAILTKTTQAAEAGVSFLSQQLPEVIQQLLLWHAVLSGVYFVILLVLFTICAWGSYKLFFADDGEPHPAILFTGVSAMFLFFPLIHELDWLQILVAPKIFLIEYAASLAK